MSGGAFDYAYCRVLTFAEDLGDRIAACDEVDQWGNMPNKFSQEVLAKLRKAEQQVRKTSALMREVEWLYSGDTSEDSFMRRAAAIEEGN